MMNKESLVRFSEVLSRFFLLQLVKFSVNCNELYRASVDSSSSVIGIKVKPIHITKCSVSTSYGLLRKKVLLHLVRSHSLMRLNTRWLSQLHVCRRVVLLFCLAFSIVPLANTQMFTLTNATLPPTPAAGHDYTQLLNETVNPANGSVSFQLNFPMPTGRGLSLPFSIGYNSGQVIFFDPFVSSYTYDVYGTVESTGVGGGVWTSSLSLISAGGWNYGMPFANWNAWTGSFAANGNQTQQCPLTAGYSFTDLSGSSHSLGMGSAGNVQNQVGTTGRCTEWGTAGGDDYYLASIIPSNFNGPVLNTPLTVSDQRSGTVYSFNGVTLQIPSSSQQVARTGLLPYMIEDRNGNQLNATQSITNSGLFAFSFSDSLKRTILSDNGMQANPEIITAGGLNYTVAWRTTSANYSITTSSNLSTLGARCASPPSNVNDSNIQVISSITLPNGQAYRFYYGDDNPHGITNPYGLISEIDYPDGGSVRYTWKLSDTYSDLLDYTGVAPGGNTPIVVPDGCQFQYPSPVLASRAVFYNGTSAAQTQTFSYSTTWNTNHAFLWDSKTTSSSTTDNIAKKTATKQYTYVGFPGNLPAYTHSTVAPQLAVEKTVSTYDWGNTAAPLNVTTKAWYDQYELACVFNTIENGSSTGHFYQYSAGGQEADDKQYDFGQIATPASSCTGMGTNPSRSPVPTPPQSPTPVRETVHTFQSFTSPLGAVFSMPGSVVMYGSGAKTAESDYVYDAAPLSTVTAVQHDETRYPSGVNANRGNLTSLTKRCLSSCTDSIITAIYDNTGQMTSQTDGCGNSACGDVIGSNHTTTYSYIDSPSGGNAAGNSNAYPTLVTDSLGHSQRFTYNYVNGQVGSITDGNGLTTSYTYNDPLNRLTNKSLPGGGGTTISYNDPTHKTRYRLA